MGAGCQEKYKHTIPPARSIDVFKVRNENGGVEAHIERINVSVSALSHTVCKERRVTDNLP